MKYITPQTYKFKSNFTSCNKNNKYSCECAISIFGLICYFLQFVEVEFGIAYFYGVIYFILIYVVIF